MTEAEELELSGRDDLDNQIKTWLKWDRNPTTRKQIVDAVADRDWGTLQQRLCSRISFGTAGLRAPMRAGFDSMNDLVVVQTAQGLCEYLRSQYPSVQKREQLGIVFGYDGRYNSKRYAELSAATFLAGGFKVLLFGQMVATPFVPFTITKLKCLAGVMVTASHNPKEDNGYKVYWTNGAQIISPHDKGIHNAILSNLEPKLAAWDTQSIRDAPLLEDPYFTVFAAYYEEMLKFVPKQCLETNQCSQLRFVYTAMHGVGYPYVKEAFYQCKLKPVLPVKEQCDADPEFPTVKFPNPEEGKSALKLAFETAEREHCTIVLANDPDADRLACAELDPKGKWKVFTGNEMGALLGWWAIESYKLRLEQPNLAHCVMLASTVSSKILAAMSRIEGFTFIETLTGFKWMANKSVELMSLGRTVLFAFEEAIGFMFATSVLDKDGVSAAAQLASMACYLRTSRRLTLIDKLREIYDQYGYHTSIVSYHFCHEPTVIKRIFERLRNFVDDTPGTYPKCIRDGEFEIHAVRDLTVGVDTAYPDRLARLPVSSSSQMITFTFKNGAVVTLRTSGTEPKIKYYAEMCGLPEEKNWEELSDTLKVMVDAIVDEFLQPELNKLVPRSD